MTTIEHLKPDLVGYQVCRESLEARYPGQFVVFLVAGYKGAHLSFHEPAKDVAEGSVRPAFPFLICWAGFDRQVSLPFALSHGPRNAGS